MTMKCKKVKVVTDESAAPLGFTASHSEFQLTLAALITLFLTAKALINRLYGTLLVNTA